MAHLVAWMTRATPIGRPEPEVILPAPMFAYFVWLLHTLNRVARSAFDDFHPALGDNAHERERYRFMLTSIPDRQRDNCASSAA
ncbi:MAG: hypothetical protein WD830_05590 [Chloroflexota bacterium]